ncbi:MAG: bifunctional methylenetetrahydrofolate dehydrogenase/methenyltetrahydrofolate cyclohydrolase FolD [Burkholderiales bacterium]|jgi:methylenetetrahydrofolate dehydrogenase (NADP+)/methenyltetrahydrofolate cyclohydrolase|nr:bifunctional methylenetetrahydrofolate dehydrogenase/methenyltetrahydrofolate cyclohydrolase FolD [Burkholderiales bacterium]
MEKLNHKLISGKALSQEILDDISERVEEIQLNQMRQPCLAVILVGNDPASQVYVKNKKNACVKVGIKSLEYVLPAETTQEELLALINQLNHDYTVDGLLVQLPLPAHLDSKLVIDTILPNKDVDGFHRYNMGSLALRDPNISPCTPHGVMYMLDSLKVNYHGKQAVILGTSNIVGRPMALELMNRGATVTMCNSKTRNVAELIATADILVAAIGKPGFVKGEWLKEGAIAIDVGINRLDDGKLCGDIDFDAALSKVKYITPVPGGVGPMTIAMLLRNTLRCYALNSIKES